MSKSRARFRPYGEDPLSDNPTFGISIYSQPIRMPLLILSNSFQVDGLFLESIEQGLKNVLFNELSNVTILQRVRTILNPSIITSNKSVTCLKCIVCINGGKKFCITLTTANETLQDEEEIIEGILREQLLDQARLLKLIKKEHSSFVTVEERLKGQTFLPSSLILNTEREDNEKEIVETILICPSWVSDVFRLLSSDLSFEDFRKLGIIGIDYYPVANFQITHPSLKIYKSAPTVEPNVYESAPGRIFTEKHFPNFVSKTLSSVTDDVDSKKFLKKIKTEFVESQSGNIGSVSGFNPGPGLGSESVSGSGLGFVSLKQQDGSELSRLWSCMRPIPNDV